MRSISLRIRSEYFDDIVSGKKKVELRKYSPYWIKRMLKHPALMPEVAVFICGNRVHRRKIVKIWVDRPENVLGRELSEQGKKDMPTEKCIAIKLGEAV